MRFSLRLALTLVVLAGTAFAISSSKNPPPKATPVPTKGEPRAPLGILTTPAEIEKAKERGGVPERDSESLDTPSYDSSSSSDD